MAGITWRAVGPPRRFGLDYEEMDERHHLTFDTYEEGKLSLEQYLDRVVFYEDRPFSTGRLPRVHVRPVAPLPGDDRPDPRPQAAP